MTTNEKELENLLSELRHSLVNICESSAFPIEVQSEFSRNPLVCTAADWDLAAISLGHKENE